MKISEEYHVTRTGKYKKNPRRVSGGSEYLTIQKMPNELCEGERIYWVGGPPALTINEAREYAKKMKYYGLRIFEDGTARLEVL